MTKREHPRPHESGKGHFSRSPQPVSRGYAFYALGLLVLINMSNYADRQTLSAMASPVRETFELSARQFGYLATAFYITSALASLPLAYWADRWSRRKVIALGTAVWSVATLACAFVQDFDQLLWARAVLGLGEAACVPSALALLSDYFPRHQRARAIAAFAAAMAAGGGLGYFLGAHFGAAPEPESWRRAFWVLGLPGFPLAAAVYALVEPPHGAAEEPDLEGPAAGVKIHGEVELAPSQVAAITLPSIVRILRIPTFRFIVVGTVFLYFALGALMVWAPTLLERHKGIALSEVGLFLGPALLFCTLLGMAVGGNAADRLSWKWAGGTVLVAGGGLVLGSLFLAQFLLFRGRIALVGSACAAGFFISWSVLAAAVIHSVVEPRLRATALAFPTFAGHLLGGAAAPPIVGHLADLLNNLNYAMTLVPAFTLAAGLVFLLGLRTAKTDIEAMARRVLDARTL